MIYHNGISIEISQFKLDACLFVSLLDCVWKGMGGCGDITFPPLLNCNPKVLRSLHSGGNEFIYFFDFFEVSDSP